MILVLSRTFIGDIKLLRTITRSNDLIPDHMRQYRQDFHGQHEDLRLVVEYVSTDGKDRQVTLSYDNKYTLDGDFNQLVHQARAQLSDDIQAKVIFDAILGSAPGEELQAIEKI